MDYTTGRPLFFAFLLLLFAWSCDDGTAEEGNPAPDDAYQEKTQDAYEALEEVGDLTAYDTGGGADTAQELEELVEETDEEVAPPDPKCDLLVEGTVSGFLVDGEERTFVLSLPQGAETDGPWPVVFNWHGFGDTASNMSFLLSGLVDEEPMPFVLVTPEDTGMPLGVGVDWDVLTVTEDNKEARLFDEVLVCLDAQYGVDWERIHSVGFSAGAIATDVIGLLRGDVVASIATFSGWYFSNPDNANDFTA
jgi:predicted peptidase